MKRRIKFLFIISGILTIYLPLYAAIDTRLILNGNYYDTPVAGQGKLIFTVQAQSTSGSAQIKEFTGSLTLNTDLFNQMITHSYTNPRAFGSSDYNLWFSPIIISQYVINKTWKTAIRAEYYQDKSGVIIPTNTFNGFLTTGISLNIDYSPVKNIVGRLEGRWLHSKDSVFETKTSFSNNNFIIGTSIAIKFSDTVNN